MLLFRGLLLLLGATTVVHSQLARDSEQWMLQHHGHHKDHKVPHVGSVQLAGTGILAGQVAFRPV
jgi:hypothetical protein